MFRPDKLSECSAKRCQDDDTGRCDEEEGQPPSAEAAAAAGLVRLTREQGPSLTRPDGLLKQFSKTVLETALNEEMTEHLGHYKNQAQPDRESTNIL